MISTWNVFFRWCKLVLYNADGPTLKGAGATFKPRKALSSKKHFITPGNIFYIRFWILAWYYVVLFL